MKTPTDMYVSLLKSRTVEDATIQRFGLMAEYHEKRLSDARKEFERRTEVVAGQKDGLIRVTLEDRNPNELPNWQMVTWRSFGSCPPHWQSPKRRDAVCSSSSKCSRRKNS